MLTTPREDRLIIKENNKNRKKASTTMGNDLSSEFGDKISPKASRRRLPAGGFKY